MKGFKVTNEKKPGALILKGRSGGQKQLPQGEEVEFSIDEYRAFQHQIAVFSKYLKVEKVEGKKANKPAVEAPAEPVASNDEAPVESAPVKKKVAKKKVSKKKATRKKKARPSTAN